MLHCSENECRRSFAEVKAAQVVRTVVWAGLDDADNTALVKPRRGAGGRTIANCAAKEGRTDYSIVVVAAAGVV